MEPPPLRTVALFIFIFLSAMPAAAVVTGGYSIVPPLAGALISPPQDPVPISFFDLTLREMLIAVCLSFCPLLVYPVEAFFSIRLAVALGYRKVEQYAVSYNKNRQAIYETIIAHPGIKFHALERLTGMKEGTLKYHLVILSMKRRIVSVSIGSSMRYFENNGRYSDMEKKAFLHLQNPTTRRILEVLSASPEVSRKDLAAVLGIAGPSISWHTKRLCSDGIITTRKYGKAIRYTLCSEGEKIFRQILGDAGAAAGTEPGKNVNKKD
jgi:predicted transcriptional regulator